MADQMRRDVSAPEEVDDKWLHFPEQPIREAAASAGGSAPPLLARVQKREEAGDFGVAADLLCLVSSRRGSSALPAGEAEYPEAPRC